MRAHSGYFRRKRSKKGLALSTAMAICIVLAMLVALLVSMASLNINTTQATVNQREAYVQAKSAIAYVEAYYSTYSDEIPGRESNGNVGEGLVVFSGSKISEGATFYKTKEGLKARNADGTITFDKTLIDSDIVDNYKKQCRDTYVDVQNVITSGADQILVLTAHSKYGSGQSYTLSKQFTIGGTPGDQDNDFKGSILYKGEAKTRFVRFHVRATSAFEGVPYFYMWYNGISPVDSRTGKFDNNYVTSSVESKLTFNRKYMEITNGTWQGKLPTGACAMSYEGNGWYVTQKTLNLTRNVHFVNGIITKTGASRKKSFNENDWNQQSWEMFAIPIPTESELGADNGIDIYFELNKNELHDMQAYSDNNDAFHTKYQHYYADGDNGVTQLNNFVKYCTEYYTIYTKTDTAIMHYRKAGVTTDSANPGGYNYEGYGWYRKTTHNLGEQGAKGYYFKRFEPISSNGHGKELIYETFVVESESGSTAQFATEEEANRWLINNGDLNAGNYLEINVNSAKQPIRQTGNAATDPGAQLSYHAWVYHHDSDVPTYKTSTKPASASVEEPVAKDLDKVTDDVDADLKKVADNSIGDYYVVGKNLNNYGRDENFDWDDMDYQLQSNGDNTYSIEVDSTPYDMVEFWVIQKPTNVCWWYNNKHRYYKVVDAVYWQRITNQSTAKNGLYYWKNKNENGGSISSYSNWWGDTQNTDQLYNFFPKTNKVRITFNATTNEISCEDCGTEDNGSDTDNYDDGVSTSKTYSVIGWMNNWGQEQDGGTNNDGNAYYKYTREMQMYSDVDGILTYSDGSLIVESGNTYEFMIAERDAGVSIDEMVDWTRVIDKDNNKAQTSETNKYRANTENAVLITPQPDKATGKPCKYYVTILYGKNPEQGDKIMPYAKLTPIDDVETFYVIGNFNGWDRKYEGEDKTGTDEFEWSRLAPYVMERQTIDQNEIVYTYKINTVQEGAADPAVNYDLRVVGTAARKEKDASGNEYPDGKYFIDYTKTWGKTVDSVREETDADGNVTQHNVRVALGQDVFEYQLSARSVVTITFTYRVNDPETSFIVVTPEKVEESVDTVYVGFHNKKLTDVNDPDNKNGANSEFETPWETVYSTYYTEKTGLNCRIATKTDNGDNWWASIPVDAQYVYFSNKPTNNYDELHSESFQFTDDITNDEFSSSESTIFFPIIGKDDPKYNEKAKKNHWTVGNSQRYFEYINKREECEENDVNMVYYGSTQNNYYDAPFVNILNTLASKQDSNNAVPKPSTKYCFSSYPWEGFTIGGWEGADEKGANFDGLNVSTKTVSFKGAKSVSYRGEVYYYIDCTSWHPSCSFMIVCNPYAGRANNSNGNYLYGYLFEDQFSLEYNGVSDGIDMSTRIASVSWKDYGWGHGKYVMTAGGSYSSRLGSSSYTSRNISQLGGVMYMWDRAGATFTSDATFNDGTASAFNYNGYSPSWFTYRIPVSNKVTIRNVKIKTDESSWADVVSNSGANEYEVEPAKQSTNVNRPLYFYRTADGTNQVFTYNIKQGVVDGTSDSSGKVSVSVYFDNSDDEKWDDNKICVHAYGPGGDGEYTKLGTNSTSYDDNYRVFTFDEGKYCYFQFYEGEDGAKGPESLKDATKKSKVVYFTGEELGTSGDKYNVDFEGFDSRTTKLLCKGSATGLTWYMHPRTSVMYAYLDMDTVNNMTTDTAYYSYNKKTGTYSCYNTNSIKCFETNIGTLQSWYANGNAGNKIWTRKNLSQVGDGLLEAASNFVNTVSEAKVYVSQDISQANTDYDWLGSDSDYMVYLEGEQLADSAFEYSNRWKAGLTNVYKQIMKDNYHPVAEDGTINNSNSNRVANNSIFKQNMTTGLFNTYEGWLRAWLDNPQYSIKKDAVRIIVDDNKLHGGGGWGQDQIALYAKDRAGNWTLFTSTTYETTQKGFYAFVFMLPDTSEFYNQPFVVAKNPPQTVTETEMDGDGNLVSRTVDKVGDEVVKPCNITSGQQYRCNTYYAYSGDKYFKADKTTETKTYSGTDITYTNTSPTKLMNEFTCTQTGEPIWVNFKYDTHVVNTSTGVDYTIFAGAYKISKDTYDGFVTDFDASATIDTAKKTGIDVYKRGAMEFFTQKRSSYNGFEQWTNAMSYGQISATGYSDWTGSRSNTGKDIDIMTNRIRASGDLTVSETKNRVNFRYCGQKDHDTLTIDRNITLRGQVVTIAANKIDFRKSGSNDFVIDSGKIIFITDTTIIKPNGTSVQIDRGTYLLKDDGSNAKTKTASLKSTGDDPDWRSYFTMLGEDGSELKGGKYVFN